ncbi:MAG: protein translocase subunit SecD, partial [Gemmatimonadota bacterium]|nr:protein translocase subunit SecD [Gemmatimonadota bacterium]
EERAFTGAEARDALERSLEIIRTRVTQGGVSEPLSQKVGDERIIVELPGIQDEERAKDLVQRTAFLEFQMVVGESESMEQIAAIDEALAGRERPAGAAADTAAQADTAAGPDTAAQADTAAAQTLEEALGTGQAQQDEAAPAGEEDEALGENPLSAMLTAQQMGIEDQIQFYVEERDVATVKAMLNDPAAQQALDDEYEWLWGTEDTFPDGRTYQGLYLVEKEPEMTGELIASASAGFDPQVGNQPIVSLDMTGEGADTFADLTGRNVNERMAIVLDQVVRMAPNIRQRITGGRAQIEGFDDIEEARDIAIVLRAGALPAPLEIIEERTVGPSLGADSIDKGRNAMLLGLLGVIVFMVFYYRGSGLVADVALILNILIVLAGLAGFGATLTLPGIAGLILTVGMAVDANVLVFERIREELDIGKSVRAAIDAGYDRAFITILDAQVTTLIAAAVLFQFGTGPIKGFAVVLTIGIFSSIFTAVFVTRTIFETWARNRPARTLSI